MQPTTESRYRRSLKPTVEIPRTVTVIASAAALAALALSSGRPVRL